MGIHGIFKQIGVGQRISLAKFSRDHFVTYNRPLRLAIDISIWLFQIQSGKGGSNPALRTFYYRLLRLLTLNVHPLFVFDGPNKPLFKRNKKVGGPGVRVANVPEFLAKQLLKQFGFPWHVAPGEAEAECALLQRRSIVDAVLSEDVDTLMFGSQVTIRNWTSEGSSKTPTHVNLYKSEVTKTLSGLDPEGMILVALMSGGDYLPDGIPGCGPKLACDAARAGFGAELCAMSRNDSLAMQSWKKRLNHEIQTNEGKHFSRKTPSFKMPDDFPNLEVLGYYTHPCVSSDDKLKRLTESLSWDLEIDYPALRTFTAEAFDWRCLGGAKKFIRNLASAILTRELRTKTPLNHNLDETAQAEFEKAWVTAIHGKRTHSTTDGELEYRISFTPAEIVPIDLSIEEEDDEYRPAGGEDEDADEGLLDENIERNDECPGSPAKKSRQLRPYDPTQPDKLWIMKDFLQVGCPLLVEAYEGKLRAAKSDAASAAAKPRKSKKTAAAMPFNSMMRYTTVVKPVKMNVSQEKPEKTPEMEIEVLCLTGSPYKSKQDASASFPETAYDETGIGGEAILHSPQTEVNATMNIATENISHQPSSPKGRPVFRLPPALSPRRPTVGHEKHDPQGEVTRTLGTLVKPPLQKTSDRDSTLRRIPQKKRPPPGVESPAHDQTLIMSYYTPSPRRLREPHQVISLVSSSPPRALSPTPGARPNSRPVSVLAELDPNSITPATDYSPGKLLDTVTKRRKKGPLKRHKTAPITGDYDVNIADELSADIGDVLMTHRQSMSVVDALDLTISSPACPANILEYAGDDHAVNLPTDTLTISRILPAKLGLGNEDTEGSAVGIVQIHNAAGLQNEMAMAISKSKVSIPRRSPRQTAYKAQIRLRESLAGAWREVLSDQINPSPCRKDQAVWRLSGLEMLDMTNE